MSLRGFCTTWWSRLRNTRNLKTKSRRFWKKKSNLLQTWIPRKNLSSAFSKKFEKQKKVLQRYCTIWIIPEVCWGLFSKNWKGRPEIPNSEGPRRIATQAGKWGNSPAGGQAQAEALVSRWASGGNRCASTLWGRPLSRRLKNRKNWPESVMT